MDLVAIATADAQIQIHRLSWQKLHSINHGTEALCLSWKPDGLFATSSTGCLGTHSCVELGTVLAAGDSSGCVTLYDVETGALLHKWQVFERVAVRWLDWACHDESVSTIVRRK
jgi:hypothetical protein